MKKRIAALFMAVVLCTGTMNLPVSATEVSVPEGQKTAEVSIPEGELPGEEKSTVSAEAAITEDSTDSGSEVEAADDASAPGTDGKSEEPDGILTESEDNGEQTPSDGEEDGAVPVLEAGQEGVPSKAPAISQENATDPTSDVPAEKDPALAGGVVSEEKEPEKPTELEVLQSRIDALPDADALAEMDEDSIKAVYDEFLAISDAWEALDEEEAESLNMDRLYEVAAYFSGQVATLEETDEKVAQIGTTEYSTLQDAIKAVTDETETTIDLLKDVIEDVVIPSGKHIVLNLNNYSVTNVSDHTILNQGMLKITGQGTVDNVVNGKSAIYNDQGGTAILEGGTFLRSQEGKDNHYYTILNQGTMTVKDGVIVKNGGTFSSCVENGWDGSDEKSTKASLTIEGGDFSGGLNTIKNDEYGDLIIKGGNFKNNAQHVVMNWNTALIEGGEFEETATKETAVSSNLSAIYCAYSNEIHSVGKLTITGGEFTCKEQYALYAATKHVEVNISGGTFEGAEDTAIKKNTNSTTKVSVSGGTFKNTRALATAFLANDQIYMVINSADRVTEISAEKPNTYVADINGKQFYSGKGGADLAIQKASANPDKEKCDVVTLSENATQEKRIRNGYYLKVILADGVSWSGAVPDTGCEIVTTMEDDVTLYTSKPTVNSAVACIGEGDSAQYFATPGDAFEAAKAGDTVTLLKDYIGAVSYNGTVDVIFDLNGHTITANTGDAFTVNKNGALTIVDNSSGQTGGIISLAKNALRVDYRSGVVTVKGGIFEGKTRSVYSSNGTAILDGGVFKGKIEAKTPSENKIYVISVSGGRFDQAVPIEYCAEGYEPCDNNDGTYGVTKMAPVAQISDSMYYSLEKAVVAAKAGDTIKMLADEKLGSPVVINKNLTLDLNGCSITRGEGNETSSLLVVAEKSEFTIQDSAGSGKIYSSNFVKKSDGKTYSGHAVFVNGTLKIKDGTVAGDGYGIVVSGSAAKATMEGGTIEAYIGVQAQSGGQFTISGGKIIADKTSGSRGIAVFSNVEGSKATVSGTAEISAAYGVTVQNSNGNKAYLEVNGGIIHGISFTIAGNGTCDNTEITISGGTLTSDNLGIFHPQVGDLTITGGTITAPNGVQYCGFGNLTITGGTIRATGAYFESPTKSSDQEDGSADDGAALALISRGGGYQEAGTSMNVTIGGTAELISENNAAIAVYRLQKLTGNWVTNDSTTLPNYLGSLSITGGHLSGGSRKGAFEIDGKAKEAVKVSGGYFSSDPTEYVAAGSAALDGHWVQSGENYYFTIGAIPDAMKIAQNPVQLAKTDTSDMTTEDKAFVVSFEDRKDSITHSSLTKIASDLANKELDSQMDSLKTQGMEALKEKNMLTGADQNMTLYLMPYMDMKIIDADAAANTLTLDITAKYNLYASTASTASEVKVGTNAVVLKEAEVMENITSKVDITVPLPDGFKTVNLKVKHIKENGQKEVHYYYTPEVNTDSTGNTVATFTNPHGFSTFILTSDERTATVEYQMADGTKQKVTYTANDVGVTKLPADSKPYHTFIGWKFPGDETVYGPSELTDDLLDKLSASGNTIIATPEFAAVTADINITKDVTDSDGKALRVDGSFYAAVFTDKDCTVRYGQIVELKLQNASRTTASVTVGVPEDGSKVTYYVAETDKNGKVVQSGEAFGYQVTLTGSEAVVSDGQKAEVGIVNRKLRSEVPTPDENPSSHSGGKKHHSSSDSSPTAEVSPVAPATTGDSTNMLIPVLCLLIGAGGIGSFMFARKKKKSVK